MLPTYQRFTASSGKNRSFRASEKILICLVFLSFLVIVLFGFFLLPDFGGTNGVIQVYNKLKISGPEIFIPAPPINGDKYGNDFDRQRLQEKIRSDLDVDGLLEKPELQQPVKVPVAPLQVPEHNKNHHNHRHDDKTTQDSAFSHYAVDGSDQDSVARERRDKVKEVS